MPWVHDLDPIAFRLGSLSIHWYGISYLVGLMQAWAFLWWWQRKGLLPSRDPRFVGDFVTTVGIAMVLGGRLGYCLFYDWSLLGLIDGFPYWGVLAVHHGGMASHGGLAGFAIGCWWFCRQRGLRMGVMGDAIAATAPLGAFCGRIANFVNGELYGRPTGGDWGVIFPEQVHAQLMALRTKNPAQLKQQLDAWGIHEGFLRDGKIYTSYTISENMKTGEHFLSSLTLPERLDAAQLEAWARLGTPSHPSQLYAACLEGLILAAIVIPLHLRHRRPWLTAGTCFALYAVGRFVGEFWRTPDAGQPGGPPDHLGHSVAPYLGFMSKGQLLTIPLLAIGLALIVAAWRRGPRPQDYLPPAAPTPPAAGAAT